MCLQELKEFPKSTNLRKGIGYKVLRDERIGDYIDARGLVTPTLGYCVRVNRWMKANDSTIYLSLFGRSYRSGFHIYLTKKGILAPRNCIIKKVKFREVVATGTQYGCPIVVAKEMLILPESKQ